MFENMTPDRFKGLENFRDQHSKKIAEESYLHLCQVFVITAAVGALSSIHCLQQKNDMPIEAAVACQAIMVCFAIFFRHCLHEDRVYLSHEIRNLRSKMGIIIEGLSGPLDRHIIQEEMGVDINVMTSAAIPMNYDNDPDSSKTSGMRRMMLETGRQIIASVAFFF